MKDAWRVFAQGDEPRRSSDWVRHAERFFDAKLAFADANHVTLDDTTLETIGRAREDRDLRDALAAPGASENGLYDLAERRCGSIWLVERSATNARASLVLAAIIASVCLGPILGDGELFGVRTAREKLLSLA